MLFNDRRANKRALKAANGPSLASMENANTAQHNSWERHDVNMEAKYGRSSTGKFPGQKWNRGDAFKSAAEAVDKQQQQKKAGQ